MNNSKIDRIRKEMNFRVIVYPYTNFRDAATKRQAMDLQAEIKRHCDIEESRVEYDVVCKFCEEPLNTSLDEKGYPFCCTKAQEEYDKEI